MKRDVIIKKYFLFSIILISLIVFSGGVYAQPQINIDVDANNEINNISRFLFGTNLYRTGEDTQLIRDFSQDTGITNFRFPGGGSPGYHWQTGLYDFPNPQNPTDPQNCSLNMMDDVINFTDDVGAEILFQINVESGTPQEAAGLLSYIEGLGYNITYWEVGNEVYGDWDDSGLYLSPGLYSEIVKNYSIALKAINPNVKVGPNLGGPYYDDRAPGYYDEGTSWDRTVINKTADYIDFLSYHWYSGRDPTENEMDIMGNYLRIQEDINRFNQIIAEEAPQRIGQLELGYLEWDTVFLDNFMRDTLANAIAYTDSFGEMIKTGVDVSNHYTFQEGGSYINYAGFGLIPGWDTNCNWNPDWGPPSDESWDGQIIKPKAFALQLFSKYFGSILIGTNVSGSPTYTVSGGNYNFEYSGPVPYVSVYSSKDPSSNKMYMILVNKDPNIEYEAVININGFSPSSTAIVRTLNGPNLTSINNNNPGIVNVTNTTIDYASTNFNYTLPVHSVTSFEFITTSQPTCYDVNNDNKVNIIDLALVIFWQGKNSGQGDWDSYKHLDVNNDTVINFADVSSVITNFGQSC